MTRPANSYRELLRSGRWFHGLPLTTQDRILAMGVVRTWAPEQRLFAQGDPPNGLFAVLDGTVRLVTCRPDGREVLLALARCPTWLGEIGVFDGQPRSHDAVADGEATALHLPQESLDAWLSADPASWRSLGMLLTTKMRLVLSAMEEATTMPLSSRLARRIVIMAEGHGDLRVGSARVVSVKQEELATMLWTSRQTINRCLKELEQKEIVRLSYGKIEIVDLPRLKLESENATMP
jgi:CRP/FNR family cyclic AMP-dependent transcriptional regulator